MLDLGGFQYTQGDPYSGGCWDIVFTADDPYSRPDPYRGELPRFGNIYGLTPLNQDTFSSTYNNPPFGTGTPTTLSSDVVLVPLLPGSTAVPVNPSSNPPQPPLVPANGGSVPLPALANFSGPTPTLPTDYFYVIGNLPPSANPGGSGGTNLSYESGPIQPDNYYSTAVVNATNPPNGFSATPLQGAAATNAINSYQIPGGNYAYSYSVPNSPTPITGTVTVGTPAMIQSFNTSTSFGNGGSFSFDPFAWSTPPAQNRIPLYPGVLPGIPGNNTSTTSPPLNYQPKVPPPASGGAMFYWVCLRRPANLFAPVSAYNPMVVVDAMRLPYVERDWGDDGDRSEQQSRAQGHVQHDLFGTTVSAVPWRTCRTAADLHRTDGDPDAARYRGQPD